MGSLYPADIVVGQRREKKKVLCSLFYQWTPVEERARRKKKYLPDIHIGSSSSSIRAD
jgi:hypothetical protein